MRSCDIGKIDYTAAACSGAYCVHDLLEKKFNKRSFTSDLFDVASDGG